MSTYYFNIPVCFTLGDEFDGDLQKINILIKHKQINTFISALDVTDG